MGGVSSPGQRNTAEIGQAATDINMDPLGRHGTDLLLLLLPDVLNMSSVGELLPTLFFPLPSHVLFVLPPIVIQLLFCCTDAGADLIRDAHNDLVLTMSERDLHGQKTLHVVSHNTMLHVCRVDVAKELMGVASTCREPILCPPGSWRQAVSDFKATISCKYLAGEKQTPQMANC